jgi:hypothetical protein
MEQQVKVFFEGDAAVEHGATGRRLVPGVNVLDAAAAVALVAIGVARTATAAEAQAYDKAQADLEAHAKRDAEKAAAHAKREEAAKTKAADDHESAVRRGLGLDGQAAGQVANTPKAKE